MQEVNSIPYKIKEAVKKELTKRDDIAKGLSNIKANNEKMKADQAKLEVKLRGLAAEQVKLIERGEETNIVDEQIRIARSRHSTLCESIKPGTANIPRRKEDLRQADAVLRLVVLFALKADRRDAEAEALFEKAMHFIDYRHKLVERVIRGLNIQLTAADADYALPLEPHLSNDMKARLSRYGGEFLQQPEAIQVTTGVAPVVHAEPNVPKVNTEAEALQDARENGRARTSGANKQKQQTVEAAENED